MPESTLEKITQTETGRRQLLKEDRFSLRGLSSQPDLKQEVWGPLAEEAEGGKATAAGHRGQHWEVGASAGEEPA